LQGQVFGFAELDSILRAYARGRSLPEGLSFQADAIGPWLELKHSLEPLDADARRRISSYVILSNDARGSLRSCRLSDKLRYDSFRIDAHTSALKSGFSSSTASKIVAALSELCANALEHSECPSSAGVAFRAVENSFEFVVADQGIGPLASLRGCDAFATLDNHGEALGLMVEEGVSRFGRSVGRGYGYRPLFVWLANLSGHLRFRAGDQAFELDGRFGDELASKLSQKPQLRGYLASVRCLGPG
jgi:anti-sigma regulatory factor (Ser/Thr protein kinase)